MKSLILILTFFSSLAFSQMPNIASVWMNHSKAYTGYIDTKKTELKMKVLISEQDQNNDQEYFLSGYSFVDGMYNRFEGKLKITQYKDGKSKSTVFGEYELAEEPIGKHSGMFTGKFVYTFKWNKETQEIEQPEIQFEGDWKSYDGTLEYKTEFGNR